MGRHQKVSPIILEEKNMAKRSSGARCICTGSKHFTYGSSRSIEGMMKAPSNAIYQAPMSSNAKVFSKPVIPAKG